MAGPALTPFLGGCHPPGCRKGVGRGVLPAGRPPTRPGERAPRARTRPWHEPTVPAEGTEGVGGEGAERGGERVRAQCTRGGRRSAPAGGLQPPPQAPMTPTTRSEWPLPTARWAEQAGHPVPGRLAERGEGQAVPGPTAWRGRHLPFPVDVAGFARRGGPGRPRAARTGPRGVYLEAKPRVPGPLASPSLPTRCLLSLGYRNENLSR